MGPDDAAIRRRRPVSNLAAAVTKASSRMPTSAETRALYMRDGWRCRFCGCRVVSNGARSALRACIPGAIPWGGSGGYHGAFFALTASVDHVVPHSAGGGNEPENLVTACWSCQFGRGRYTIEEVGLSDPRCRPPIVDDWDGLCRVVGHASAAIALQADVAEAKTPFAALTETAPVGGNACGHTANVQFVAGRMAIQARRHPTNPVAPPTRHPRRGYDSDDRISPR